MPVFLFENDSGYYLRSVTNQSEPKDGTENSLSSPQGRKPNDDIMKTSFTFTVSISAPTRILSVFLKYSFMPDISDESDKGSRSYRTDATPLKAVYCPGMSQRNSLSTFLTRATGSTNAPPACVTGSITASLASSSAVHTTEPSHHTSIPSPYI